MVDGALAADGPVNHHRLTILTDSLSELVGLAGGWVFDRARAGWDVNVRIEGCGDARPLAILGANAVDDSAETVLREVPRDGALAVSAKLLREDPRVRARVFELAKRAGVEVMAWGDDWPAELGSRIDPIEHRLSVAARAFKAHALAAAELDQNVGATETLFDLATESLRPLNPV
ncbi:hypothetical protein DQP55_22285 [Mycolicibacterium sp. GF69]|nr:hypothetical protein DQP55_22285 [Mycolicibacterium sp. GF69]